MSAFARPLSLHARVLLWLFVSIAIVWPALWLEVRQRAEDAARLEADNRLRIVAAVLIRVSPLEPVTPRSARGAETREIAGRTALPPALVGEHPTPSFELLNADNAVIARTADFPTGARGAEPGFESRSLGAEEWRIYTVTDMRRGLTCRVAAPVGGVAGGGMPTGEARLADPLLAAAPLALLLGFGAVWMGLRPLREIETALAGQNPDEPRSLRIDASRYPRELRTLVTTLNSVLDRLRASMDRRKVFASLASHEIRTPLAGCLSQIEVARGTSDPAKRDGALEKTEATIVRLTHLVRQLLTLARSERTFLKLEDVDLAEAVDRSIVGRAAERISLDTDLQRNVTVRGDHTLIEAMIGNLVDNAVAHAPRGSAVAITVRTAADMATVSVCDRGPGIADAKRSRIFEPFQRGGGQASGSGLGLTIVKAVAEAHGGSVALSFPASGGTVVTIHLPRQTGRSFGHPAAQQLASMPS